MRVPSGGKSLSAALVRTMIQCESSQLLAGNLKLPGNTPPDCRRIVSPQETLSSAALSSSLLLTGTYVPGAGVSASALLTYTRGSSAGPSKRLGSAFCACPEPKCGDNK